MATAEAAKTEQRALEFSEGSSSKFWTISLDGTKHVVHWGRIGTAGQAQEKDFPTEAQARAAFEKLVAEKLRKGYVEVAGGPTKAPVGVSVRASRSAPDEEAKGYAGAPAGVAPAEEGAAQPGGANVPEFDVTPSLKLDPVDWLWATWRPRSPLPVPPAPAFDVDEAVTRLRRVVDQSNWWSWDWSRARISVSLTREEAWFWLLAMTRDRRSMYSWGNAHEAKHDALVAAVLDELRRRDTSSAPDPEEVTHVVSAAWQVLEPELLLPLRNLLAPVHLVPIFEDEDVSRVLVGRYPGMGLNLTDGFRSYVLPYLAEGELQTLRDALARVLDPSQWPAGHDVPPGTFFLAAAAGVHAPLRAVVERWPDDRYAEFFSDTNEHPQEIVLGLENPELVEHHMRRLRLRLRVPRYVRAWLAHTEHRALDYPADTILEHANKEEAARLANVLRLAVSPEAAPQMLRIMNESRAAGVGRDWLDRHPAHAAAGLLPVAAGAGSPARAAADHLTKMVRRGLGALVETALERDGTLAEEATARLRETLLRAPEDDRPVFDAETTPAWLADALKEWNGTRQTKRMTWVRAADLPPITVGRHRLSDAQGDALLGALAASVPEQPHHLVRAVREHADPGSRDAFAWALFETWLANGAVAKESWALRALGHLGGDRTALRLTPLIRAWPGEAQHARAVIGLDCLRAIGTDTALMQINGIAQKVKFKGLQAKALECVEGIAQDRGLTRAQLEDRIVPDCGLDERGERVFDFGPRQFRFVLGPDMKPVVRAADGALRPNLPAPGARDDAALAGEAVAEWKLLKKQVAEVAKVQAVRLEQAMVTDRRWTAEEFETLLVRHPLMSHLVRLLVWGAFDSAGALAGSFRVTEDLTYAGASDETYVLPVSCTVGVAHPLHLDEAERAVWGELFGDYEIVPPFPQLGRRVHRLEGDEARGKVITRFANVKVPPQALVFILEKKGWQRGLPLDGGMFHFHTKPFVGTGVTAVVEYEGIPVGYYDGWEDQAMERVYFLPFLLVGSLTWDDYRGDRYPHVDKAVALSTVDPLAISEVLSDLSVIASKGK
jgi:predicted DNA-binding WGR domain protein